MNATLWIWMGEYVIQFLNWMFLGSNRFIFELVINNKGVERFVFFMLQFFSSFKLLFTFVIFFFKTRIYCKVWEHCKVVGEYEKMIETQDHTKNWNFLKMPQGTILNK
jgi:hypothetical protein